MGIARTQQWTVAGTPAEVVPQVEAALRDIGAETVTVAGDTLTAETPRSIRHNHWAGQWKIDAHFLKEYDAKKRMQRGVFYTPRPVVSYIVRSVDELLRTQFGLGRCRGMS
jgi:hypothetical protein